MVQTYFQHIKDEILKRLNSSEEELLAAVAWITDSDIYASLHQAAKKGMHIIIILNEDDINRQSGVEWGDIKKLGATILWSKSIKGIMHHKFCIVDRKTVLTGSYNWTYSAAHYNEESLLVIDDEEVVKQFLQELESLLLPFGVSLNLEEGVILSPRITELKIKIPLMEAEIALLEEKYVILSAQVQQFLFRVQRAIGDLLLQWRALMMQKALKLAQRTESKADRVEYESSRQDYEQARSAFEQAKTAPAPQKLTPDEQADLKKMYREAVMLAHPDKYPNQPEKQAQANRIMAVLSEAYKLNDYEKVKNLWQSLSEGTAFSLSIDDTSLEQLESYYENLLMQKGSLQIQLDTLKQSEDYKNWEQYQDSFDVFIGMVKEDLEAKIRLLREEVGISK